MALESKRNKRSHIVYLLFVLQFSCGILLKYLCNETDTLLENCIVNNYI
jgi:hypothetical protein